MDTINIGNQTWATENLSTTNFQNGDEIPLVDNFDDWASYSSKCLPCCAYLDNKKSMVKYGLFYNGFCVTDSRNICPDGFRVPKIEDIIFLTDNLGFKNTLEGDIYYNSDVAFGLKGSKTWKKSFFGEPGDNSTGMNFLAGGNLTSRDGMFLFDDKGFTSNHWLLDEHIPDSETKFFPAPPVDWPVSRMHKFCIGTGSDHSMKIGTDFLIKGLFLRLIHV